MSKKKTKPSRSRRRNAQQDELDLRGRFGFRATPFTREIQIEQRFRLPIYDQVVSALYRAVDQRQSACLIAPAGTGKSVVLRALKDRLPEARYQVRYVKVASLSRRDMCREIAIALGCEPAGAHFALVRRVQERYLTTLDTDGLRPVLLLDEAHEMRPQTLGLLKVLTNFDMDSRLVVSIVLAGQAPLRKTLLRADMNEIAGRVAHCAELRLLSRDELRSYVEHRCTVAGATQAPFDEGSYDALFELSRGNMRAADHLARKALECAAGADHSVVDHTHVLEARKTLLL